MRKLAGLLFVGWLTSSFTAAGVTDEEPVDLLIRGGVVIDGTGRPALKADVAIRHGRIVAVGEVKTPARGVLDANDCVVAPGFIDVHTHAEDVLERPGATNFVRMGVTTVVAGNCGSSARDIAEFFSRLRENPPSINVATLVGHGTVRRQVMHGSFDREPTPAELRQMQQRVRDALRAGAVGLSTGLIYLPGTFAKTEELIAVARVAGEEGGLYATHMRSEGDRIFEAIEETIRIAREARLPAHISHLKLAGPRNWGKAAEVLARLDRARAEGLRLTHDQYLYTASSTGLSQLIPDRFLEGGKFKDNLADPERKAAMKAAMKRRLKERGLSDYGYAVIAWYKHDASLNGLNVVEAARRKFGADSLDAQIELILDIQAHGGASAVFHGMSEEDLRTFLQHPLTMIASDSGVREFGKGRPHPRGYGNSARLLARYVRELRFLSLEEAVRRMTSLPATTFKLADRGVIRPGAWADLVVFDPREVRDRATFEQPHQYATGFTYVLVNGVIVVERDRHTGARPGGPLSRAGTPRAPQPAASGE